MENGSDELNFERDIKGDGVGRRKKYHDLDIEEVFTLLDATPEGISENEAYLRMQKFGANTLPETKQTSTFILFLRQFKNPLIYILLGALTISFVTKHYVDAWVIFAVVVISSVVGFLQEYKAGKALSKLKKMVTYKAKVLREGKEMAVLQEDIFPGDIILLFPGDKIPADARLIESQNFEVIEATLTGESNPSSKQVGVLLSNTALADRENMVFMGTVVARGTARAVVTHTGTDTELGTIAQLVNDITDDPTPLQKQIAHFGKFIILLNTWIVCSNFCTWHYWGAVIF